MSKSKQEIFNKLQNYIRNKDVKNFEELIENTSPDDLNYVDTRFENTILMSSLNLLNDKMAKILIDSGKIDIDKNTKNGNALTTAISMNNFEIVKYLLEHGSDPEKDTPIGKPVCYAFENNTEYIILRELLKYIENINLICDNNNNSLLGTLIIKNQEKLKKRLPIDERSLINNIKLLLENNINPFLKNKDNKTILEISADLTLYSAYIYKLLKERGIDLNYKIDIYNNILTYIIYEYSKMYDIENIVKKIKNLGVKLNIPDDNGVTPLMYSIENIDLFNEVISSLNVKDINMKDNNGDTVLHYAVEKDLDEIVKILLEKGADSTIKNNNNKTPIDVIETDIMYKIFGIEKIRLNPEDIYIEHNILHIGENIFNKSEILKGSTKPVLYVDSYNKPSWIVKNNNNKYQNIAEKVSGDIYNIFNDVKEINTYAPQSYLSREGYLVIKYVNGKNIGKKEVEKYYPILRKELLLDAILANWDFYGLVGDNLLIKDDKIYHIDNGSTFNFRAQGTEKKYGFVPLEIWTLRDKDNQAYDIWYNNTPEDIWTNQLSNIISKYDEMVDLVYDSNLPDNIKKSFEYRLILLSITYEYIDDNIYGEWKDIDNDLRVLYEKIDKEITDKEFFDTTEWVEYCNNIFKDYIEKLKNTANVIEIIEDMFNIPNYIEDDYYTIKYDEKLDLLLDKYINKKFINNDSLLQVAINEVAVDLVKELLETNKFDLKYKNDFGYTPLVSAINKGNSEIIEYIYNTRNKGFPNEVDNNGSNALLHAIIENIDMNIIEKLINDVDINHKNTKFGVTVLMVAIDEQNIEIIEKILTITGINLSIQNNEGNTALMDLIETVSKLDFYEKDKFTKIFIHLLKNTENINLQNNDGDTILTLAITYKEFNFAYMILSENITKIDFGLIKKGENFSSTILMYILYTKDEDLLEVLLDNKDKINIYNNIQYVNEGNESSLSVCLSLSKNNKDYYYQILKSICGYYNMYNIPFTIDQIMYIKNLETLEFFKTLDKNIDINESYYDIVEYIIKLPENIKDALKTYTNKGYETLNYNLRNNILLSKEDKKLYNAIKYTFLNIPSIKNTITVYRGILDVKELDKKSYNSSSTSKYIAYNFYNPENKDSITCCLYNINIPAGSKVLFLAPISILQYEKEVLLDANCEFILNSVDPNYKIKNKTVECIFLTYRNFNSIKLHEGDFTDQIMELQLTNIFENFISNIELAREDLDMFENINQIYKLQYPLSPEINIDIYNKVYNKIMQKLNIFITNPNLPTFTKDYLSIMTYNVSWEALEATKAGIDMSYCKVDDINLCRKNIADIITKTGINYIHNNKFDFIALQEINVSNEKQWGELLKDIKENYPDIENFYEFSFEIENKAGILLIYNKQFHKKNTVSGNFHTTTSPRLYQIVVFEEGIIYINVQFPTFFDLKYLNILKEHLDNIPEFKQHDYQIILSGDFNNDYTDYINIILGNSSRLFYISKSKFSTCCNPRKSKDISAYDLNTDHIYTTIKLPIIYNTLNTEDINKYTKYGISYMSDHLPVFELLKLN